MARPRLAWPDVVGSLLAGFAFAAAGSRVLWRASSDADVYLAALLFLDAWFITLSLARRLR